MSFIGEKIFLISYDSFSVNKGYNFNSKFIFMVRDKLRYIFSFSHFMFWPISEIFSSFALSREIISTRSSLIRCEGPGGALKAGVRNRPGISIGEGRPMGRLEGFFELDPIWSQMVSEFVEVEPLDESFGSRVF